MGPRVVGKSPTFCSTSELYRTPPRGRQRSPSGPASLRTWCWSCCYLLKTCLLFHFITLLNTSLSLTKKPRQPSLLEYVARVLLLLLIKGTLAAPLWNCTKHLPRLGREGQAAQHDRLMLLAKDLLAFPLQLGHQLQHPPDLLISPLERAVAVKRHFVH